MSDVGIPELGGEHPGECEVGGVSPAPGHLVGTVGADETWLGCCRHGRQYATSAAFGIQRADHHRAGVALTDVEVQLVARSQVLARAVDVGSADVDHSLHIGCLLDGRVVAIHEHGSVIALRGRADRDRRGQARVDLEHGDIEDGIEVHDRRIGGSVSSAHFYLRGAGDDVGDGGHAPVSDHHAGAANLEGTTAGCGDLNGRLADASRRERRRGLVAAAGDRDQAADEHDEGPTLLIHGVRTS